MLGGAPSRGRVAIAANKFLLNIFTGLWTWPQGWSRQGPAVDTWYLDTAGPVGDSREALRGRDVVHQEERLGSVKNLSCDAVKPSETEKQNGLRADVWKCVCVCVCVSVWLPHRSCPAVSHSCSTTGLPSTTTVHLQESRPEWKPTYKSFCIFLFF